MKITLIFLHTNHYGKQVIYVGTFLKKNSLYYFMAFLDVVAIEEAITLMKHACSLEPRNPHSLLTYVHMLEVRNIDETCTFPGAKEPTQFADVCSHVRGKEH